MIPPISPLGVGIILDDGTVNRPVMTQFLNDVRNALLFLGNAPVFRVNRNGTNQVGIPNSLTPTKIQFNSIANTTPPTIGFDPYGWFDITTNFRWQPKIAGTYLLGCQARFTTWVAASRYGLQIRMNGVASSEGAMQDLGSGAVSPVWQVSSLLPFNGTTDYAEFFVFQATGGAIDLDGAVTSTFAWGGMVT